MSCRQRESRVCLPLRLPSYASRHVQSFVRRSMASRKVNREEEEEHLFDDLDLDRNPPPKDPRVDELVNEQVHELGARLPNGQDGDRVPGSAVAGIQGKKLVHLNCYGYANLETGAKITPATIFELGSLSKQFTAIAVLDLVNRGRIDLTH